MAGPPVARRAKAAAFIRANAVRTGLEAAVNIALPFAIYTLTRGSLGDVRALIAASAPPLLWSVVEFIRLRKVDAIAIVVLTGIALSLLAFAGGGGVKFLQLRENLVTGLVGLIFLGSVLIGRPLIHYLAGAGLRRLAPQKAAAFEALRNDPAIRRVMTVATLAWAAGLLAASAVNSALVFQLSIRQFLLVSGPISYATIGLLTVWTSVYLRRIRAAVDARMEHERG
jgi:hypothetical protein